LNNLIKQFKNNSQPIQLKNSAVWWFKHNVVQCFENSVVRL